MYLPHKLAGDCTPPDSGMDTIEKAVAHAKTLIAARALDRIGPGLKTELHNAAITEFHIFGGALLRGTPNDLDLAPAARTGAEFTELAKRWRRTDESQYGQALLDGVKVQFCLVEPGELKPLIDDFDFAHCRVGATLTRKRNHVFSPWEVKEVYLAPPFVSAMLTQGTFYAGGRWPMRSLSRIAKVALKLGLSQDEAHALALQVMGSIAEEGFREVAESDPRFIELVTNADKTAAHPDKRKAPREAEPFNPDNF
jgi:hypothetical protein